MIKALMGIIENFLASKPSCNDYVFFDDLEYIIFCNVDLFDQENPMASAILYDEVMELCLEVDYMADCTYHREKLRSLADRLNYILSIESARA